jgi:hypothetical protein
VKVVRADAIAEAEAYIASTVAGGSILSPGPVAGAGGHARRGSGSSSSGPPSPSSTNSRPRTPELPQYASPARPSSVTIVPPPASSPPAAAEVFETDIHGIFLASFEDYYLFC